MMCVPSAHGSKAVTRELKVLNKLGLHARPAAEFVRAVRTFRSAVWICIGVKRFDAGRIMDLLMANLDQGAAFKLIVEGPDAEATADRIQRLLEEFRDGEERGDYS